MWKNRQDHEIRLLEQIVELLQQLFNRVSQLRLQRIGESIMTSFAPGNSLKYQITVAPANATVVPSGFTLVSSDPNVTTSQDSADTTGSTFDVVVGTSVSVGASVTLTATYTNADETQATASLSETVVPNVVDVKSISITQVA